MSAPGHGTQPSAPCQNCGRALVWYVPSCKHCDYDTWTGRVGGGGYEEVRANREAIR